jgi:predicted MFS family arabinose efflux permease
MSAGVTAFIFGIGVGTWIYTKMMHNTGGDYKNSYIVAGVLGFFAAAIFFWIAKAFFHF